MNWIAHAYDILSDPAKRLAREADILKHLAPTGARVLDLACGTGVHADFFAELGCAVTACDLSPDMITEAKAKRAHPNITYLERDMRTPPEGEFDLIYCIGNSLDLLPSLEDINTTLANTRNALAPTGKLLLHVQNPECESHRETSTMRREGEIEGKKICIVKTLIPTMTTREDNVRGRIITITVSELMSLDAPFDTASPVPQSDSSYLLDVTRDELTDMLAKNGYGEIKLMGGFDGAEFKPAISPDIIVVATAR